MACEVVGSVWWVVVVGEVGIGNAEVEGRYAMWKTCMCIRRVDR